MNWHLFFGLLFFGAAIVGLLGLLVALVRAMAEMVGERAWGWLIGVSMLIVGAIGYVGWMVTK